MEIKQSHREQDRQKFVTFQKSILIQEADTAHCELATAGVRCTAYVELRLEKIQRLTSKHMRETEEDSAKFGQL